MSLLLFTGALCLILLRYAQAAFRKGLRNVPGPFWARLTTLYRISIVYKGEAVENYRRLHEKYGPVVRTGPYHVSVSDPQVIPLVYGIASKFRKASKMPQQELQALTGYSRLSTA